MRFHLYSLSTTFQIDAFSVNTLSVFERISVDGRPKHIEMYAFSNENALVWTGPEFGFICETVLNCTTRYCKSQIVSIRLVICNLPLLLEVIQSLPMYLMYCWIRFS